MQVGRFKMVLTNGHRMSVANVAGNSAVSGPVHLLWNHNGVS